MLPAETIIKVTFAVLFLLYAYFMVGGYTPCVYPNCQYVDPVYLPNYRQQYNNFPPPTYQSYPSYPSYPSTVPAAQPIPVNNDNQYPAVYYPQNKNIYQMGPYLDF